MSIGNYVPRPPVRNDHWQDAYGQIVRDPASLAKTDEEKKLATLLFEQPKRKKRTTVRR